MKILIDVNMRFEWKEILLEAGFEALHWRDVGARSAPDEDIIRWAADRAYVVITQDLDFSEALAMLKLDRPSVVVVRTRNNKLQRSVPDILWLLKRYEFDLEEGALIMIDHDMQRIRRLPFT